MAIKSIGSVRVEAQSESEGNTVSSAEASASKQPASVTVELHSSNQTRLPSRAQNSPGFADAMGKLAHDYPEPVGYWGTLQVNSTVLAVVVDRALENPQMKQRLKVQSDEAFSKEVKNAVAESWPALDAEKVDRVSKAVMQAVRDDAKCEAAFEMKNRVVGQMRTAGDALEKLASDPKSVSRWLEGLERLPASEQKRLLQNAGLGEMTQGEPVSEVRTRLQKQADLLKQQANHAERTPVNQVFQLAARHEVSKSYMNETGIQPGSVMAGQIEAAKQQGKEDEKDLERLRFATAVLASFGTAGMGAVGLAGIAVSSGSGLFLAAPTLHEKQEAVDEAKAGEAAGTMADGSVEKAEFKRNVAVAAAFAESVGGPIISRGPAKALDHTLSRVMTGESAHRLSHAVVHASTTAGVQTVEHHITSADERH